MSQEQIMTDPNAIDYDLLERDLARFVRTYPRAPQGASDDAIFNYSIVTRCQQAVDELCTELRLDQEEASEATEA